MKTVNAISTGLLVLVVLAGCDQLPTPADAPPGTTAVVLTLTATKTYVPNADYAGGTGVMPYYSASDAVLISKGDSLVLRVASGDSSAPTSVQVAIAGIQKN